MVGNDVVDLADPDCNPALRHPRFDERAFTGDERRMIAASGAAESMRWLLWAAKESAYKLLRKLDPAVRFSPVRLRVRPHFEPTDWPGDASAPPGYWSGTVSDGTRLLPFRAVNAAGALHVVAVWPGGGGDGVLAGVEQARPESHSSAVREVAIAAVAKAMQLPADDFRIRREGRVPRLLWRDQPAPIDLSLSHHGRFVAFAASLAPTRGLA